MYASFVLNASTETKMNKSNYHGIFKSLVGLIAEIEMHFSK